MECVIECVIQSHNHVYLFEKFNHGSHRLKSHDFKALIRKNSSFPQTSKLGFI